MVNNTLPTKQNNRDDLKKYLRGKGIEIGALQNALKITGLPIQEILYVDKLRVADLRKHYPELGDIPLVEPDILDDAQQLKNIKDNSLDFIIANHLIEHLDNPLLALKNWYLKLKPRGILFLAVPDKRFTFDKERKLTSIQHLSHDYKISESERQKLNHDHFSEWVACVQKKTGDEAEKETKRLMGQSYAIHFHIWTYESFLKLIDYVINKLGVQYKIIDYSGPLKGGNEFIFILQKQTKRSMYIQILKNHLVRIGVRSRFNAQDN